MLSVLAGAMETARAAPPLGAPAEEPRVEWNEAWTRFQAWEYVATPLALAGSISLRVFFEPREDKWTTGPSIDEAFRASTSVQQDSPARDFWQMLSDYSFRASMVYPAVDVALAGLVHRSPDVAWQMLMMDLEAFAVTSLGIFTLQALIARERPYGRLCGGKEPDADCGAPDRYRSFPSGHVAIGVTGAAVTCMHHARMPLYGGRTPDAAACWAAVLLASGNFIGRVAANRHYMTDVVVGSAIGILGGYVTPAALHYGFRDRASWRPKPLGEGARKGRARRERGVRVAVAPLAGEGGAMGAQAFGIF